MDLLELRREIDRLDEELVSLFCQRMEIAAKVADYKKENNLPIHHPGREQEVLEKVGALAGPEWEDYTKNLYVKIFELSKAYQKARNNG